MSCLKASESKAFAVFVMWATLVVSYMLYGAIVPLLPKYAEGFTGEEPKMVHAVVNHSNLSVNSPNSTTGRKCQTDVAGDFKSGESSRIIGGLVGTSKVAQLLSSPFVGLAIDKIGVDVPLFMGYAISVGAAIGFMFVQTVIPLFVLRATQGIGAAFLNTAALTTVTHLYQDDDETRGTMIGYAVCGISVGLMLGPPFGSVMFQIGDKFAPFLSIAILMSTVAALQLCIRLPKIGKLDNSSEHAEVSPWKTQLRLITDPYVFICLLLTVLGLIGIGFIEGTLPNHMVLTMCPQNWMLGVVFVPMYIGLGVGTPILSWLCKRYGRWIVAFFSYIIAAGAFAAYPFCRDFYELLIPGFPLGFSSAAKNAAILPILAYLVDARFGPWAYGSAYALADIALSIAFAGGPLLAGLLVPVIGFGGVMFVAAGLSIFALFPLAFLRKPLGKAASSEETPIISKTSNAAEDSPETSSE